MITYLRPVTFAEHPVTQQTYIVPTPSIDALTERVKRLIRLRTPGAIIYAYPRFGKTYSIRYVINVLQADFPESVFISFGCEFKKAPSEDGFFANLLEAVGHKGAAPGSVTKKRIRLIERICELVDRSGHNWVVFFGDEAQKLGVTEYEWLRDVHDKLERRGIRMITFLVGQPQLLHQKTALRQSNHTQIVLRFMIVEMRFDGLCSAEDIATCLAAYDEAYFPQGSDWSYTRFFYPNAYDSGLRLLDQANVLWEAFCTAHANAGFTFDIEIPMQYFAHTVEIALSENKHLDAPDFRFSRDIWNKAIKDAMYVEAQEELRLGLPATDLAAKKRNEERANNS
ncbi:AAA family ATPase [Massilia varians]|uniref:ATP-binding protein n=2 Tax=Massilia TaxID=149698 RepID=A0ABT2ARL7_9BURK|nr:ATP-binding protein [Massilia agri]MCS0598899.1 ATP-binding protein [Massilia agri]QOY92564.1 ATP-binding protein [Massilia sp. UMI-21]